MKNKIKQMAGAEKTTEEMGNECFGFTSSFACNDPKMLCFGGYNCDSGGANSGQESGPICMDHTTLPKPNRKRNGSGNVAGADPGCVSAPPAGRSRSCKAKKAKSNDTHLTAGYAKVVKKEKLGERISVLQQLVSPFGKTDTSSVLHEAFGYIRFLQDQVQVLCSPYLQSHDSPTGGVRKTVNGQENNVDLRSKGLCLVPIELTSRVADESNSADLWSSAAVVDDVPIFRL